MRGRTWFGVGGGGGGGGGGIADAANDASYYLRHALGWSAAATVAQTGAYADLSGRPTSGAFAALTKTAVKTANYSTPGGEIVPTNTASAQFTLQLPTVPADGTLAWPIDDKAGLGTGWPVHSLILARGGSDTIDGVAANAVLTAGRGTLLQYDAANANWRVLLSDSGLATAGALIAANNLSDLASAAAARTNLGVRAAPRASAAKSALFTLAAGDNQAQDEATGTWTLTVPAASTLGDNFAYTLTNVGAGTITLDGPGATNGSLTAGQVATIYSSNGHVYVALGTATTLS